MSFGLSIANKNGQTIIDNNLTCLRVVATGYLTSDVQAMWSLRKTYTHGSQAIFVRPTVVGAYITGSVYPDPHGTLGIGDYLHSSSGTIEYIVVDSSALSTESYSGYGLQVFNADGSLAITFNSASSFCRFVGQYVGNSSATYSNPNILPTTAPLGNTKRFISPTILNNIVAGGGIVYSTAITLQSSGALTLSHIGMYGAMFSWTEGMDFDIVLLETQ